MEQGVNVRETPILQQEIGRLDELFVTGTTSDVTPIVQLDGRPIGIGNAGPHNAAARRRARSQAVRERAAANPELAGAR